MIAKERHSFILNVTSFYYKLGFDSINKTQSKALDIQGSSAPLFLPVEMPYSNNITVSVRVSLSKAKERNGAKGRANLQKSTKNIVVLNFLKLPYHNSMK